MPAEGALVMMILQHWFLRFVPCLVQGSRFFPKIQDAQNICSVPSNNSPQEVGMIILFQNVHA